MKLLDRIGNAFERATYAITVKAAAAARRIESFLSQAFVPKFAQPPRKSQHEWLKMATASPWLYAAERPIGYAVASAALTLWASDEKKKQIPKHPLLDLLNTPNPFMTRYDLFYLSDVWSTLAGEWFWVIERGVNGAPWQLWPVPPSWVRETPTIARPFFVVQLQGYGFAGNTFPVPKEDMICFRHPDPAEPFGRGKGPAEAAADEVETDEHAAKYDAAFYYNSAIPGVVITYPAGETLKEGEAEKLTQSWKEKFQGFWKSFQPAVLTKGADVKILNQTRKENEHLNSRKFRGQIIGGVIGTPKLLMGDTGDVNRSTAETSLALFREFTVIPHLVAIENTLNIRLVPMFEPAGMFLELAKPNTADKEFLDKQIREDVRAGLLRIDEARKMRGYEDDPATHYYLISRNFLAVQDFAQVPLTVAPAAQKPPLPAEVPHKAISAYATRSQSEEEKFIEQVLFDIQEVAAASLAAIGPQYGAALTGAGQAAMEEVSFPGVFAVENPAVKDFLAQIPNRVTGITQTTYDALKESLLQGYKAGEGITELMDRVSHERDIAKNFRTENIARTEMTGALNGGSMLGYAQAEVPYKGWLATIDERTRISHLDAQTKYLSAPIPMDQNFVLAGGSGPCPGMIDSAAESCMCRCSILPFYEEDLPKKGYLEADLLARDERFHKALAPEEAKLKKILRKLFTAQEEEVKANLRRYFE